MAASAAAPATAAAPAAPGAVLVYSHSWLPGQVDGVAVRMMAHTQALVKRGTKVVVMTPDFVVDEQGFTEPKPMTPIPGVEHITLQTQRTPVYRKNFCMRFSIQNLSTIMQAIRRLKPDYVHGTQEAGLQVLATACFLCDVPLIVSMHTDVMQIAARDEGFSTLGGQLGRLHARMATMGCNWGYRNWALAGCTYFPVSKHARALLRSAGVGESSIAPETWGPMVDRDQFTVDLPKDKVAAARKALTFGIPDAFLMVYVGRVTAEKDIEFLVEALDRNPKNVVLALIGPGSLVEKLKLLHGKERRIHCTGEFVGREQVALNLRGADCCVSASTMETVGFTAMESVSCGTPMLAANAQGFAEHLSHGVNARLWTPHDAQSFDKELKALMATSRTGQWAPEVLRASMTVAAVDACTDRALRAYLFSRRADMRALRYIAAVGYFLLQWLIGFFVR